MLFEVQIRSSWTHDDWINKFAEVMKITPDMARAIESPPGIPNEVLKYAPVTVALQCLELARNNPSDPGIVYDRWLDACGVV